MSLKYKDMVDFDGLLIEHVFYLIWKRKVFNLM
jgi:hypothetical protein